MLDDNGNDILSLKHRSSGVFWLARALISHPRLRLYRDGRVKLLKLRLVGPPPVALLTLPGGLGR